MREGKGRGSMEGKKGPGEERIGHRERKGPRGRPFLDYTFSFVYGTCFM